jgi:hypothetical protein
VLGRERLWQRDIPGAGPEVGVVQFSCGLERVLSGFVPGARDGDEYKFFVVGGTSSGYKRDPWDLKEISEALATQAWGA